MVVLCVCIGGGAVMIVVVTTSGGGKHPKSVSPGDSDFSVGDGKSGYKTKTVDMGVHKYQHSSVDDDEDEDRKRVPERTGRRSSGSKSMMDNSDSGTGTLARVL